MSKLDSIPSLRGTIVEEVVLVDFIERRRTGRFQSESLPGHLIHIVTHGEVEQNAAGIVQHFGAEHAIWYNENEPIQGRILQVPWRFYTVSFMASALPPPPLDQRVRSIGPETVQRAQRLLDVWRQQEMPAMLRHMHVHRLLLEILVDILPTESHRHRVDAPTQLWWKIETMLRANLSEPIDLAYLERRSRRSRRSIIRACHLATGLPPMKRVKQVRLSYGRGLVQLSDLTISEIAYRVGYQRVQEFSRDYRKHFGISPCEDRKAGPTYQRREPSANVRSS